MEPTKLETDFQNKLNQREINPSTNSWDRLDAMLTVAEQKKSKRSYDWLYLAASIIGFLCIGALFFSQTEELVDTRRNDVVLDANEIVKPSPNTIHEETNKGIVPSVQSQSVAEVSEVKKKKSNPKESELIIKNQVAQNSTPNNEHPTPNNIINQKSEQLNPLNQDNVKVDERITAVEIPSKNATSKSSIKVDAQNLLSQVDGELELSFREKVINTIDKNYKTVKVAIANRNYQ
ncbi:hypothetical protein [Flavobacterium psychrotolerans]|uniref:Uncharacterized protein n=1 Tax=Flavobacterium psychrotolerans TaxID=2169410 RepID=A0A2U1JNT2_9FLAO|nr:hypothetical protein [Flavobacterium psychrotolerans]PWA06508.1 hypothetical protein DB895_03570 [Flavobacterium psychrotolerans]